MRLSFNLKSHFFSAFREIFIHHHGSLEFRAKIFALVIAADPHNTLEAYMLVKKVGLKIYKDDEQRANFLVSTTEELVEKVKDNNGLDIDSLIDSIVNDVKMVPRYAKKIDVDDLKQLLELTDDLDTRSYQENILEFLENLKNETLNKKTKD